MEGFYWVKYVVIVVFIFCEVVLWDICNIIWKLFLSFSDDDNELMMFVFIVGGSKRMLN